MELSETRKRSRRPRPVVTCLRCREKKLRCDRLTPCVNCIKAGCRADCTYNRHPVASNSLPNPKRARLNSIDEDGVRASPPPVAGIGIIEDLQQRVGQLEELLAVRPHANASARDVTVRNPLSHNTTQGHDSFLGTLVTKGSRSRFHGQNDRISLLNQFPDTKTFINQCAKDESFVALAKEVQFLQSKSQLPATSPESLSDMKVFLELQQLSTSLPPKAVCDRLLEGYQRNCEKALRIIHLPSFLRQYTDFWNISDHELSELSAFVPLLTTILTVAVVCEPEPAASDQCSSWEYLRTTAISLVQAWLDRLPRKQRIDHSTLQVETLLLLSQQMRSVSAEELWKSSGALVRSAMAMGLHVNLAQSTKMTPFQAETRRRLWASIVEIDLQASLAAGMPAMTPEFDTGPLMPGNLNDSDFDEHTTELPSSRPFQENTDSSMQLILAKSLSLRIRALNLALQPNYNDNIRGRLAQGRELETYCSQIPSFLSPAHVAKDGDSASVLNRVLLDVFLRRPLLLLYRPILTGQHHDDADVNHTQQAFLESCIAILSYQDSFDPKFTDLNASWSNTYWDVFQTLFQNDILCAALGVCEHMRLSSQQPGEAPPSDNSSTPAHNKTSLTRLVENTLDTMTRRIGTKGTNIKDILLLTLSIESTRTRGSTEEKERWMSQCAKNALSTCRQHLLSAAGNQSFPFALNDFPQLSNGPGISIANLDQTQLTPTHPASSLPDFLQSSSALAAEFDNFQSDLFDFDDGSFMWNL